MIRFGLGLLVAFILFSLTAEATSTWLIIAGSILACLTVVSAMITGYFWAQKRFQDDVDF